MKKKRSKASLTWKVAPSVINDKARKMMRKLAKKRDGKARKV